MPPAFRAAILDFSDRHLAAASDQPAGLPLEPHARPAAIGTRRTLRRLARVSGQLLDSHLAGHHVADPDHGVFDVINILAMARFGLCRFLGEQLGDQRLDPLLT